MIPMADLRWWALGALLTLFATGFAATPVPGKIEAESYTAMSGIQLQACSEGTQNVGWIDTGDWMEYAIQVSTAGSYTIQYRVASPNSGGVITVSTNGGSNALGTVSVPNTGGWQNWQTISHVVSLPVGTYSLRVRAQVGGFNVNWINIVANGSVTKIPGKIEAECYTAMSGIQIQNCSEGTQNVGWIDTGDWMEYAIQVPTAGNYGLQYRVASPNSGGVIAVSTNGGVNALGALPVPNTGGWQSWQIMTQSVNLPAGTHSLRVSAQTGGFNLNWINVVAGVTSNSLPTNGTLPIHQQLTSSNGLYRLTLQGDGNLVLSNKAGSALWATGTNGKGGVKLILQGDSNPVLYTSSGSPVWSSNTVGTGANLLRLNDDGSLVLYKGSSVVKVLSAAQATTTTFTLSYAPAPADNPLKGFMPYAGSYSTFPHSTEWFYIPLKDIQTDYNTFNWEVLDSYLSAIAGRGHQAVFGVYIDYPNKPYGMPAFLSSVPKHAYSDYGNGTRATSYCPDYSNANLQKAILNFIAALGRRYDNDPRIGFIHTGLLGFWGEWHTYPHNEWMASPTFMNQVLDAFENAFPNTLIMLREPKNGVNSNRPRLGFHDDSFAYETLGPTEWHFWPKMKAAGLQNCWTTRPIGGEVRPEVQPCLWDDTSCAPSGQGFADCVATTHASLLLNHEVFLGRLGATQIQRALAGARSMGYILYVSKATPDPVSTSKALVGTVTLENRGVAPFYYPWPVQVAVMNGSNQIRAWAMNWDLRTVLPGSPVTWSFNIPNHGLAAGSYTLLLGVPNPMTGGRALKFANSTQDQHRSDWLTLGSFTVHP